MKQLDYESWQGGGSPTFRWGALSSLVASALAAGTWILMRHYQRLEGDRVLDVAADAAYYHLVLETIPTWGGTVAIVAACGMNLWRLWRRSASGGQFIAAAVVHAAIWYGFCFVLAVCGEDAFP
jgi:hypothetical protein